MTSQFTRFDDITRNFPQEINVKQNALHSGYMTLVKSKIVRRKVFVSLTEKGLEMSKRRDGPIEGGIFLLLLFFLFTLRAPPPPIKLSYYLTAFLLIDTFLNIGILLTNITIR